MNNEINKLIEKSDELQAELAKLKSEKYQIKNKTQSVIDQLKNTENKIEELRLSQTEIIISDHAIVRYLERVEGIDMEDVKKKIATEKVTELINKLGNGIFPVNDVFKITVNKKVITTVLLNGQKTSLSKKQFSQR